MGPRNKCEDDNLARPCSPPPLHRRSRVHYILVSPMSESLPARPHFSARRMGALVRRNVYLLRGSWPRLFDLDPGEEVAWGRLIAAALEVRARLDRLGLRSFVKTSGGKGLHVVAPIMPEADWDKVKSFTQDVAEAMAADSPDRYVAKMTKSLRGGKIFIDYLRNGRGATAVAAYSTRARANAPVSTPLAWDELSEAIKADHFTLDNLRQRLAFIGHDPWADCFRLKQKLRLRNGRHSR